MKKLCETYVQKNLTIWRDTLTTQADRLSDKYQTILSTTILVDSLPTGSNEDNTGIKAWKAPKFHNISGINSIGQLSKWGQEPPLLLLSYP